MITFTLLIAASVSLTTAQLQYNETTNEYTCAEPEQAYCVVDSMQSSIIVRCYEDVTGAPGNCDDVRSIFARHTCSDRVILC